MLVGLAKSQARDAMQNYLRELIPPSQIHNATKREGLWEIVELCNGSKLTVYTVGQGEDTHQGGRRSLIVYDEQPTQAVVEEGLFRFREDMESKILITMTPTKGKSWVYDELILKADEKQIALVHASVFENGVNLCTVCDKRDKACECEVSQYRRLECQTCNHDRKWWDDELMRLGLQRQTEAADEQCWRCRTYGVEPRLSAKKVRSAEQRVTDPKRLAMRLHGK